MNKAFIKEADGLEEVRCPRCGSPGTTVGQAALETHLRPEDRHRLGDTALFCGYARCEVVYFDHLESVATIEHLRGPVSPKSPDAPLCACFGFTQEDVEADVAEGTPTRIRALLARSKSPEARCQTLAANGQCCLPEIQRLYFRLCSK